MPYTGSPPTFTTGEKTGVAAKLNQLRDFIRAFTDPWTAYTPTLTAATTNPTGWTTQSGRYMRAGKLAICSCRLAAGAGVTAGTGAYRVALPAQASSSLVGPPLGSAYVFDSSAGVILHPRVNLAAGGTYLDLWYPATAPLGANTPVGPGAPFTWAVGDEIGLSLIYEAA